MSLIVLPNGTINSGDVQGDLPPRSERPYWRLSGRSIVVDVAEQQAARREEVSEEAERRINAIVERRKQLQLIQRAVRLIMKVTLEQDPLTAEEQAEIAAGEIIADKVKVILVAEQALLAMDRIPADYADDRYWQ